MSGSAFRSTGLAGFAGGVLSGNYPDPGFAVDMATQAELGISSTQYVTTTGSDADDGRTWSSAKATPDAALTYLYGLGGSGTVVLGYGNWDITSTLVLRQGVRLLGTGNPFGSQGSSLTWAGADDGSYVIRTANDTSGSDFSGGLIKNLSVLCGTGYTDANGIYARNLQNDSLLEDIYVKGFPGTGIYADAANGAVPLIAFPGYATFNRVWVTGNEINWHFFGGFTSLLFLMCASDMSSISTDAFIVDPATGGEPGGKAANYVFIGFKTEDVAGGPADPDYFTVNTDAALAFIGCSAKKSTPGTKPWINYTVVPSSANTPSSGAIPVTISNCQTSNIPVAVNCSTGPLLSPAVAGAGEVFQIPSWTGWQGVPQSWVGTHPGIDGTTIAMTPEAATLVPATLSPAFGQSAHMFDISTFRASDTFTRADSSSSLGTSSGGQIWTPDVGTWGIAGDRGYLASATDNAAAHIDAGSADGYISCDVTLDSTQAFAGVVFRFVDKDNTLSLLVKSATNELLLNKRTASVPATIHGISYAFTLGGMYALKVGMFGAQLAIYVNGLNVYNYTLSAGEQSTFLTGTNIGLRVNGSAGGNPAYDHGGSRFDNLGFSSVTSYVDSDGNLVAPSISPVIVPNIIGSRGSNAALASLLTSLATIGLITDGSSP